MAEGNDYAYRGTQDSSTNATDFQAQDFHIRQVLETSVRTAIPAKVVKAPYDKQGNPLIPGVPSAIGYIDVQPMVNQLDGYGQKIEHGTVSRISYFRPQGANGAIISDPVVGDIGKVVVADRDTSVVRETDAVANPGSGRKFDLADGTFFGSIQAKVATQWVGFRTDGIDIVDKNGTKIELRSDKVTITVTTALTVEVKRGSGVTKFVKLADNSNSNVLKTT